VKTEDKVKKCSLPLMKELTKVEGPVLIKLTSSMTEWKVHFCKGTANSRRKFEKFFHIAEGFTFKHLYTG
jgi:hypothetical protein